MYLRSNISRQVKQLTNFTSAPLRQVHVRQTAIFAAVAPMRFPCRRRCPCSCPHWAVWAYSAGDHGNPPEPEAHPQLVALRPPSGRPFSLGRRLGAGTVRKKRRQIVDLSKLPHNRPVDRIPAAGCAIFRRAVSRIVEASPAMQADRPSAAPSSSPPLPRQTAPRGLPCGASRETLRLRRHGGGNAPTEYGRRSCRVRFPA